MTTTTQKVQCAGCDWTGDEDDIDLADVPDLFERLDPGGEVPAGECPECGMLAYLIKNRNKPQQAKA